MALTIPKSLTKNDLKAIFNISFIAGSLDIIAAIVLHTQIIGNTTTIRILQYIASAVYGSEAFAGGLIMAILGLLFHFFISFSFAVAYYLVVPYFKFLQLHKIISGLAYGTFIWAFMSFVVVPLTQVPPAPFKIQTALLVLICHLLFVGLPISLLIGNYYASKNKLISRRYVDLST